MYYFIGAVALLLLSNLILTAIVCTDQFKAGVVNSYCFSQLLKIYVEDL